MKTNKIVFCTCLLLLSLTSTIRNSKNQERFVPRELPIQGASYSNGQIIETLSEMNNIIVSNNTVRSVSLNDVDGFSYSRYDFLNRHCGTDFYFTGLCFHHDSSVSDTTVSISRINLINASFGTGVGVSVEGETPFGGASLGAELNSCVTKSTSISFSTSKTLKMDKNDGKGYNESGDYFLYVAEERFDSMIVKQYPNGSLCKAQYFTNQKTSIEGILLSKTKMPRTIIFGSC